MLTAVILVLCVILPACIGPAVEEVLSDGVSFSGIRLAVTAPQGDETPQLLEQYMGKMRDISRYCSFHAMTREQAMQALEDEEVTAVLVLPQDFVSGIMTGENPAVELLVPSDRPLESMLTLWVGQSAADLLSAAQNGIYAVIDAYEQTEPEESNEQVVIDINLRYINVTLNRETFFHVTQLQAAGTLPISLHYGLCLTAYMLLALAPLFYDLFSGSRMAYAARLRSAARSSAVCLGSSFAAVAAILFPICAVCVWVLSRGNILLVLAVSVVSALLCAWLISLCCLLTSGAAGCGLLAFAGALLSLGEAGGIVPPVLLPQTLRQWQWLSPVSWLRDLTAYAAGYETLNSSSVIAMAITAALAAAACAALYRRKCAVKEELP